MSKYTVNSQWLQRAPIHEHVEHYTEEVRSMGDNLLRDACEEYDSMPEWQKGGRYVKDPHYGQVNRILQRLVRQEAHRRDDSDLLEHLFTHYPTLNEWQRRDAKYRSWRRHVVAELLRRGLLAKDPGPNGIPERS